MSDHPKLERLLRLLMMLSGNYSYTLKEIAVRLEMTERTVYRYIETLRDAGFIVNRNDGRFTIARESPYLKDIGDLIHFTREEAWILNRAILALDDETCIKQCLARKLYSMYDLKGVPYPVVKKENSDKVIRLIRSMEDKTCVMLTGYQSSNSSTVADRMVEPFEFTLNYGFIWCFEHESGKNKLFKTARIEAVKQTDTPWRYESSHQSEETDVFRISGKKKIEVSVTMTMRAANLLIEEYPMAEAYLQKVDDCTFLFKGWVSSLEGIGRFLLGLPDEIIVISPVLLKTFLNRKIAHKVF